MTLNSFYSFKSKVDQNIMLGKNVGVKKFLIILLIVLAGFFIWEDTQAEDLPNIIINEIAWMGTDVSSSDEWIEIRSLEDFVVDLEGWMISAQDGSPEIYLSGTIKAGGYFLLERTDDESAPGVTGDLFYSGALGNSGEFLGLADSENNLIDFVDMVNGWEFGDNGTKQTMERKESLEWQTSSILGGTPGEINSTINSTINGTHEDSLTPEVLEDEPEVNNVDYSSFNLGDLVINEFVSDPADNDTEWVEIFNNTSSTVDLSGWYIEESGGSKTNLSGLIDKFFVVNDIKGNLNNGGDSISLYDNSGGLIDKVIYGKESVQAPVATDPKSTARRIDGNNTFNNFSDFAITKILTKGKPNIIDGADSNDNDLSIEEMRDYDYSNEIIVSEILPNPIGDDAKEEFIELCNKGKKIVNLKGWRLGDESKSQFEIKNSISISPNEFLVFKRSQTKIALNNSGDSVKLFEPLKEKALEVVEYKKAEQGWSYVKDECATSSKRIINEWSWTLVVTPGELNYIEGINNAPQIQLDLPRVVELGKPFVFDGSDTFDLDGDELDFSWNFGDGINLSLPSPAHTYLKTGEYVLKFRVSDGEEEVVEEKVIKVVKDIDEVEIQKKAKIIISEILPNPKGDDKEGEFIEIKNIGENDVNLRDWVLKDLKSEYKFGDFGLASGAIAEFAYVDTKINLNNTNEEVSLINASGDVISKVNYDFSFEGNSYAVGENGNWFWTIAPSPGEENIINFADLDFGLFGDVNLVEGGVFDVEIDLVRDLEKGSVVRTEGIVTVLPGILGSQYFYVNGIQIYSYKKDFPDLSIGDVIEINGEVSISGGEKRIKTKTSDDIEVIEKGEFEAEILSCEEANNEKYVGIFVSVEGEVIDKKGASVYLDDGTGELRVYIKKTTGISAIGIKKGDNLTATGIVGLTNSGVRLLPRSIEDIKGANSIDDVQVLGEAEVRDEWKLESRNKKQELLKYLLVILGGVILILGWLLIRKKKFIDS